MRKYQYLDTAPAGHQEMAKLMEENNNCQNKQERHEIANEMATKRAQAPHNIHNHRTLVPPPWRLLLPKVTRMPLRQFRARGPGPNFWHYGQRQARHRYRPAPPAGRVAAAASRVASTSAVIAGNPMRRARNSPTATSLAALRTVGAAAARLQRAPRQRQRGKTDEVGRLEGQVAHPRQIEPRRRAVDPPSARPGNGRSECACRASRAAPRPSHR